MQHLKSGKSEIACSSNQDGNIKWRAFS